MADYFEIHAAEAVGARQSDLTNPYNRAATALRERYSALAKRAATSALAATRLFCLECMGAGTRAPRASASATDCTTRMCSLWPFRAGTLPKEQVAPLDPPPYLRLITQLRITHPGLDKGSRRRARPAVRLYCLECTGGSRADTAACTVVLCPLYPHREGKAVNKRHTTPEQAAAAAARFKAYREAHAKTRVGSVQLPKKAPETCR